MSTVWLDHMEVDDEGIDAFLLEEQMIMNQQQQQQQLPQTNDDVPQPQQVLMNTITTTTTTAATNPRAEDIISWLGIDEDDDDDDVYIPTLPALPAADDVQEVSQEHIYNNLQMNHHQVEGVLDNNNDEDQRLFMNVFDHQPNPIINNPDDHFPVTESPFLLDILCNINDLEIRLSHHQHNHDRVLEEIPPETNYHQASSSCLSPLLVDQNQFFDDPDVSEFTLINDDVENHNLLISTTQLANSTSSATQDHINEDLNSSHVHQNPNNVSTMVNKVVNNATDGATTIVDQGDGDDDDEDNEQEEMDADGECDENPNSKTTISTITSTSSLASPSASASTSACKNLVSERNRRKRLGQQLLALRSLVPNITKMDKRSVLVDALAYLRSIHEETTRLQNELKHQPPPPQSNTMSSTTAATTTTLTLREEDNLSAGSLCIPRILARTKPRAIITEIDTERIENQRFVVKITCKVKVGSSSSSSSSNGVGGDVLRVMESLGFDITYTSTTTTPHHLHQTPKLPQNQQVLLTTLFIKVRNNKHGKMTEEKLKECISNRALRCGLTFQKSTTTTTVVP